MTDKQMIKMLTDFVNFLPRPDDMEQQALTFIAIRDTLNYYKRTKDR